jgi:hypothetical protein
MSTLIRSTQSKSLSLLGRTVPQAWVRWIVRLWISAVIVGSLLPGSAKERIGASTSEARPRTRQDGYRHRFVHVLTFGSTCLLVSLLAWNRREELQAAGEVLVIGCLIELAQDIVYLHGNLFEWWDVRDDAIGIALAFITIRLIHRSYPIRDEIRPAGIR